MKLLSRILATPLAQSIHRIATGVRPNLRSLVWGVVQLRTIRRRLRSEGTSARVPLATGMGPRGWYGVRTAIAVSQPSCLERALLVQAWIGGYSTAPDVVIGVRNESGVVEAHAWVDGGDPWFDASYEELTRLSQ